MSISLDPWQLDPAVVHLNHGSFGACPSFVSTDQDAWRERMERDPTRFLAGELEVHLDAARDELAALLSADARDLAFVPNATAAISTVVRSLTPRLRPGDEILTTDHEYNATLSAAIPIPPTMPPQPLPPGPGHTDEEVLPLDPLHDDLLQHGFQVPVYPWPASRDVGPEPMRLLRISAQHYNDPSDYTRLCSELVRRARPA